MAFDYRPFPDFSWSYSRHKTFIHCKRQYYYTYYGSHNGWLQNSDATAKLLFRLKKMQTLPLAFGEILHDILAKAMTFLIKYGELPQTEEMIQYAKKALNIKYQTSTKQQHLWIKRPSKHPIFQELYYFKQLDTAAIQYYNTLLPRIIHHFMMSPTVKDCAAQIVEVKQLEDFNYMMLQDIKVYVVLDFLYVKDHIWHITDWKTGKPSEDDREQLMLYAHYVHLHYGVPYDNIQLHIEYLAQGTTTSFHVDAYLLNNILYTFKQSSQHMKGYMADIIQNEPLDVIDFEQTKTTQCQHCNYYELCY